MNEHKILADDEVHQAHLHHEDVEAHHHEDEVVTLPFKQFQHQQQQKP
jgi:hypothetical protein